MDISQQNQGAHATAAPLGQYVASITAGRLRIHASYAPESFTEVDIRIQHKDVTALRWNGDGDRVVITSSRLVEIVDLQDDGHHVRLDNGSGGLGRFASADFVAADQLLVTWEFGKAKVWNLSSGRSIDLADMKTVCTGNAWRLRPQGSNAATLALASISRSAADDVLHLYLPASQKTIKSTKLPTLDAQALSWSPDGRWLAVLDTPTASTSVHFCTPDGHLFRSYPSPQDASSPGLGIKSVLWAGDSHLVGLTRFDGKVVLLRAKTFAPVAMVEQHTIVDQNVSSPDQQAPIWQEVVSASGERSYTAAPQPFSPPLSRTKASVEPGELGVAEACFSCDGAYLATRDERMLNTVWIWDTASLVPHAVIVQHSNVRRMQWHPARPGSLMLDCSEAIAYLFSADSSNQAPIPLPISISGSPALSWLPSASRSSPSAILCNTKSSYQLMYPEGRPARDAQIPSNSNAASEAGDEGDDSLLDLLSGRTPLPDSYTARVDLEVDTDEADSTTRMDDTFRGKQVFGRRGEGPRQGDERDPLDDSDIF